MVGLNPVENLQAVCDELWAGHKLAVPRASEDFGLAAETLGFIFVQDSMERAVRFRKCGK